MLCTDIFSMHFFPSLAYCVLAAVRVCTEKNWTPKAQKIPTNSVKRTFGSGISSLNMYEIVSRY